MRRFLSSVVLLSLPATGWAATWTVCPTGCDYSTISDAENDTAVVLAGDIIEVIEPGTYTSAVDTNGRPGPLTIRTAGAANRSNTILLQGGNDHYKVKSGCELTLEGFTFQGDTASTNERCIKVQAGSTLTLRDVEVRECVDDNVGSAIQTDNATATLILEDSTITLSGRSDELGTVQVAGVVIIDNTEFVSNQGSNAGALRLLGTATATIRNGSVFRSNQSVSGVGGAIHALAGATLDISDTTFDLNTASSSGGAIYSDTPFTVTNTVFTDNTASTRGGALWLSSGTAQSVLSGVSFSGHSANSGGAVTVEPGGSMRIEGGSSFTDNEAVFNGGALYANDATVVLDGVTFEDNRATDAASNGGAVYTTGTGASLTVVGGAFRAVADIGVDQADQGGALYADDGTLDVSGGTVFEDLQTTDDGGAIYDATSGLVTIADATVTGVVTGDDGAVYIGDGGQANLSGNWFEFNDASGDGGALRIHADLSDVGSYFGNNSADDGGAVSTRNGATVIAFNGSSFVQNTALFTAGAVEGRDPGALTLSDCDFTGNVAGTEGGHVNVSVDSDTTAALTVSGGAFTSGGANGSGGAIWMDPEVTVDVSDADFRNNQADADGDGAGDGGAVYLQGSGLHSFADNTFWGNTAALYGGALYFASGTDNFSLIRNDFCDNSSTDNGGALYLNGTTGTTTRVFENNLLRENTAPWEGSAVYASSAAIDMVNNHILGNDSTNGEGALWFNSVSGRFVNNLVHDNSGGGIFANSWVSSGTNRDYNAYASNAAPGGLSTDGGSTWDTDYASNSLTDVDLPLGPVLVDYTPGDGDCANDILWPLLGSPLIDAGDPAIDDVGPPTSRSDIGAYGGQNQDPVLFVDGDGDGFTPADGDCDDGNSAVFPGGTETPLDGIDGDCDGLEDCYQDIDLDGYGTATVVASVDTTCTAPGVSLFDTDCDDANALVYPGAIETIADGIDQDCDTNETCYEDGDGDGDGSSSGATAPSTDFTCTAAGVSATATDCDDGNAAINGSATEGVADGIDQDCDGQELCYTDGDLDGVGGPGTTPSTALACDDPGVSNSSADCDDADDTVYPGAPEVEGDGADQDCDGNDDCYVDGDNDGYGTATVQTGVGLDCATQANLANTADDCDDGNAFVSPGATESTANAQDDDCDGFEQCFADADEDGYGADDGTTNLVDASVSLNCDLFPGSSNNNDDCNDADDQINPDATEVEVDGIDQNCDGLELCFEDTDQDGQGTDAGTLVDSTALDCIGAGVSGVSTDCDDNLANVYLSAPELEADGVDQDCDGLELCWEDQDQDGSAGTATVLGPLTCDDPWMSLVSDDCDDSLSSVYPGAPEIVANLLDEDCDGVDTCFEDLDLDGIGSPNTVVSAGLTCAEAGVSLRNDDCDDSSDSVNPEATEVLADGVDQDCDGLELCFTDLDLDGYAGSTQGPGSVDCSEPGVSLVSDDCNDSQPSINPGAVEVPADLIDQDCDLQELCFEDLDADNYGTVNTVLSTTDLDCDDLGESLWLTDCDDGDINVYPGAPEITGNAIDEDCDNRESCYLDLDGDGDAGPNTGPGNDSDLDCSEVGFGSTSPDCDDSDPSIFLGAPETTANGVDESCDGFELCYFDNDLDGDGVDTGQTTTSTILDCTEAGSAPTATDCNDNDSTIYGGAPEIPNDGIDQDCGGGDLNGCYWDGDDDGYGILCDDALALGIACVVGAPGDYDCTGTNHSAVTADCDDLDSAVNPGAVDPCDAIDQDCDGVGGGSSDEDGDGLAWDDELLVYFTDGCVADTDMDGIDDGDEILELGSDALNPDTDGDYVLDGDEVGVSVLAPLDTDGDIQLDVFDIDDDGDGVDTADEDYDGSVPPDPINTDSDGDGTPDFRDVDDDGDLLTTVEEDLDGDGNPQNDNSDLDLLPNYRDVDDDGDGVDTFDEINVGSDPLVEDSDGDTVSDGVEFAQGDSNSDGIPDILDIDDDGDGILTVEEGDSDFDGDGVPNYLDDDSDSDGASDLVEGTGDSDGDGAPNFLDPFEDGADGDPDADGLTTGEEQSTLIGSDSVNPDTDGDLVDDGTEVNDALAPWDTDGDGELDVSDPDDEGDGVPTFLEMGPECPDLTAIVSITAFTDFTLVPPVTSMHFNCADGTVLTTRNYQDTDGDSTPDYLDTDDDGDGVPTLEEDRNENLDWFDDDMDGDGVVDFLDGNDLDGPLGDLDGDGTDNAAEGSEDSGGPPDTDGDGAPDYMDEDSDNDGVPDLDEMGDGDGFVDSDGDLIPDWRDPDDDGDGIPTEDEGRGDVDGDGIPNHLDDDSDGDGALDSEELQGDVDCDGIPNFVDSDDSDGICDADSGLQGTDVFEYESCAGCDSSRGLGSWWLALVALIAMRRRRAA